MELIKILMNDGKHMQTVRDKVDYSKIVTEFWDNFTELVKGMPEIQADFSKQDALLNKAGEICSAYMDEAYRLGRRDSDRSGTADRKGGVRMNEEAASKQQRKQELFRGIVADIGVKGFVHSWEQRENGMIEVISELAEAKYSGNSSKRLDELYSPATREAQNNAQEAFGRLQTALIGDDRVSMLMALDEAQVDVEGETNRENYIRGFIDGYLFLTNLRKGGSVR